MSSRHDQAPRRVQQPQVEDPNAGGVFRAGNQGQGLEAVSPENLARARAATAETRALRTDAGTDARLEARSERPVVRLVDMNPAARLVELDRRIADFALLDDVFSGARVPEDLNRTDKARAREALQSLASYQSDVPELRRKSERIAIAEVVRGLKQWRDETAKEDAKQNEPAPQPRLEQFTRVRPKGYGSTDWYILSVEPDKGTYIIANRTLVQRDREISARDIVGNIRRGSKDNLGIFSQRGEPVGFEMKWKDLEALTGNAV